MPFLLTLIVGAAAGMLAVKYMNFNVSVMVSIAIGVLGAILGSIVLRSLAALFISATSVLSMFIGAVFGAVVLIWIYRRYFS